MTLAKQLLGKLADKSAEATKEIEDLITESGKNVSAGSAMVKLVDESIRKIRETSQAASQFGQEMANDKISANEIGRDHDDVGSIIIVIATDAPLDGRQLTRLSKRASLGLARTGSTARHGSGDFMLAFSTANVIPHYPAESTYSLMHMADTQKNFWGGHAIVGAHLPIAMGMALGDTYGGRKNVTICMFGEGATNIGTFYDGLNMAAVWKLPLVIIVENNRYGMGTAVARASAVTNISEKACAFDIPATQIDGDDVILVRDTVRESAERARQGGGPQLIEARTYRFRGHSMGDPQRYRTKEEVEEARKLDPIMRFREEILREGLITEADAHAVEKEIEEQVNQAIEFAETSPAPTPDEICADVLVAE